MAAEAKVPHSALAGKILLLHLTILGISSWALNQSFEGKLKGGNGATLWMVGYSLIASLVGIATSVSAFHHCFKNGSKAAVSATSIISLLLTLLAFGLACKHIDIGGIHNKTLTALSALVIIVAAFQLIHTVFVYHYLDEEDAHTKIKVEN